MFLYLNTHLGLDGIYVLKYTYVCIYFKHTKIYTDNWKYIKFKKII